MGFDAAQFQVEPFLPEGAHHHADGFAFVFENRALLDVRFEVGTHGMAADFSRPGVTDGVERLTDGHALGVDLGQGFFKCELFREHTGAHHARGESRSFFVGPHHHFQRCFGFDVQVVERAQHFDASEHAETAVKLAAGGLGVDVAAGHDRWQVRIAARTAGENVAHGVDADGASGLLTPVDEDVPRLTVEIGQGQATDASLDRGAELGQLHERLPQAIAVDVLMGGLQNVYGRVHDDLLRLFLWISSGNSVVFLRSPSLRCGDPTSPLPQVLWTPETPVGAGLPAMRPDLTPQISQQSDWAASRTTRNKSPHPAPTR
ncbi:hypothetical protein D3C86_1221330 [compost metagenome]